MPIETTKCRNERMLFVHHCVCNREWTWKNMAWVDTGLGAFAAYDRAKKRPSARRGRV